MKNFVKISLLGLLLVSNLNAMNQNPSCFSKTCAFCDCFFTDLSEAVDFGENVLSVVESADPRVVDKAILASIITLFKAVSPELVSLALACKNKAAEIPAEHQDKLKAMNLIDSNGQVTSLKVINTVNSTVVVSPK